MHKIAEILYQNRLFYSIEEFETFEATLAQVDLSNPVLVYDLCLVFDDETESPEVMYGLIHCIEAFEWKDALKQVMLATPRMMEKAAEWADTMHRRILNHDQSRIWYKEYLHTFEPDQRQPLIQLLQSIKLDTPDRFKDKIDEIIGTYE
ncbi:Imm30 family immunity protein [Lysinibacillus sp. TE18511]